MGGKSYRDLDVRKEAMLLVVEWYRMTETFPKSETDGLTSQLRRAAVSIPSNIAEGQGRQHEREFLQHVAIAYGSLAELETHIQIARQLGYVDAETEGAMLERSGRIGRMLNGLRKHIEKKAGNRWESSCQLPTTDHRLLKSDETGDWTWRSRMTHSSTLRTCTRFS
jgi:four helix bundle protein